MFDLFIPKRVNKLSLRKVTVKIQGYELLLNIIVTNQYVMLIVLINYM